MTLQMTWILAGVASLTVLGLAPLAIADETEPKKNCAPYVLYYPTGEMLSFAYYPDNLDGSGISGKATIECKVQNGGKLACKVLSETPEGYGFGPATVKLFQERARVKSKVPGGRVCEGGIHVFTYSWEG